MSRTITPAYDIGKLAVLHAPVNLQIFESKLVPLTVDEIKQHVAHFSISPADPASRKRAKHNADPAGANKNAGPACTKNKLGPAGAAPMDVDDSSGDRDDDVRDHDVDPEEKNQNRKLKTGEALVQDSYNKLFRAISPDRYRDTSLKGYPTSPNGQIDCTWLYNGYMSWSLIVKLAEIKESLRPVNDYHSAVGQVVDRMETLFNMQPSRQYAIAAVLGNNSMELWHLTRDGAQVRSGVFELISDASNHAFQLLVRFASSEPASMGYVPSQLMAPFVDSQNVSVEPTACLRLNILERQSLVFAAVRDISPQDRPPVVPSAGPHVQVHQPVAVKLSPIGDTRERAVLERLNLSGISSEHRIRCLSFGPCTHANRQWNYMCLAPFGFPLTAGHEPAQIATVFSHIAGVLRSVHAIGILHADVSPANIVYVEALDAVSGVLIDWHVSFALAEVPEDISSILTESGGYTPLITPYGLRYPPSFRWDWESLFLSLLGVLSDGRLPWRKAKPDALSIEKYYVVTHPEFIERLFSAHQSIKNQFVCFRLWLEEMRGLLYGDPSHPRSVRDVLRPLTDTEQLQCYQLWLDLPRRMQDRGMPSIFEEAM